MSQSLSVVPAAPTRFRTLVEVLPAGRARAVTAVVLGAFVVAAVGQVAVPLWFTPVPLSLGTLAVLGVGAALGPRLAAASIGLFAVAGVLGAPAFAGGASGWAFASFGYILGYLPAAVLMGRLARTGRDRSVWRTFLGALLASTLVYAVGAPWLAVYAHLGVQDALALGVTPFLVGDAIKAAIVSVALPGLWAAQRFVAQSRTSGNPTA
ncbi:BioY protein [Xylanimonas cellulosilytica DSM 15894]|uniref:Biotin transporter n=1 Tax=Xylanimonas cellulosilytica (strain DSM 15894 / JCM 12276 / CECT 5975 / KCTC 9989 / LMG 20990 / NBRC 107835 / XIL07) TaxID=446471 RepID=D1BY90_XYLCX|nr:biotin transporter BioY [Xylanimonas cellulosilytica]ACZ29933.1 BioY protein [Xylanimonas cellulosilytica DSM 15894]